MTTSRTQNLIGAGRTALQSQGNFFVNDNPFLAGATLVALMGLFGGAVRWVWSVAFKRLDKRQAAMDAREQAFNLAIDSRLEEMRGTITRLSARVDNLGELVGKQRTAIHLLGSEVHRANPDSPALEQVNTLLGDESPLFLRNLPKKMRDQLRQLDAKEGND